MRQVNNSVNKVTRPLVKGSTYVVKTNNNKTIYEGRDYSTALNVYNKESRTIDYAINNNRALPHSMVTLYIK